MQPTLKRLVPSPVRKVLRNSQGAILDLIDSARGLDLPPHRLRQFIGDGDFTAVGEEHLRYFIKYGKLRSDQKVLDVGCGIGRMALPLTRYLSAQSEYYGFDPTAQSVEWCTEHIASRYPNFHFEVADLHNDVYNPLGKYNSENFRFPYPDDSFDFIFLTSVFTHLFPDAMKNYFSEISRVLGKGGRSFITYFLVNAESNALTNEGKSSLNFRDKLEGCWTAYPDNPEAALAFDETSIRDLYQKGPMQIEDLKYGGWCGRQSEYGGYQDFIIGLKS
jgi:ubiquinone/menaquinone biosynthesis C-methylase UbiE